MPQNAGILGKITGGSEFIAKLLSSKRVENSRKTDNTLDTYV